VHPDSRDMLYLYLAIGGVAGTLARHGLGGWVYSVAGTYFPWGTLAVNLLGSLLLGFLSRATQVASLSPDLRSLLTVGFCGAFTTFSTFSYETVVLLQEGAVARAAFYAFGSVLLGLLALWVGIAIATETIPLGG
jgi:fluoride exporter